MFYEAELSAKTLCTPENDHFALSVGHKLLYEIDPWCAYLVFIPTNFDISRIISINAIHCLSRESLKTIFFIQLAQAESSQNTFFCLEFITAL